MEPVQIAVVGVGGWGKNLARNFHQLPDANLKYVCDLDQKKLDQLARQLPGTALTRDYDAVLRDPEVQAVVVATPAPRHFPIAKLALEAGKDVYVEKPFTLEIAHAVELIALAEANKRVLMVGHLLEYHPVVTRLREMIGREELGRLYYIYSQRVNLGTVRADENALWNFAPHDISVIMFLLGAAPTDVAARGQCYLQKGVEDVVFLTMNFGGRAMAHVHVSWLDPHKIRKLTLVGDRKMAVFDDLEANEKLRIYDKGAQVNQDYNTYAEYVGLRFGDITMPYIKVGEPLQIECRHFIECVRSRKQPVSDGQDGLRVVKVLDAAQRSLKLNGEPVQPRLMRYASLSLDLDNQWSYMKTHGDAGWQSHPSYPDAVVPRILEFLAARRLRSVSSSLARMRRSRRIARGASRHRGRGHVIGNHSFRHEPWLHLYSAAELDRELRQAEDAIESATGVRTRGFRGPGFSISANTLEVLLRRGYQYDATVFPNLLNPLARAYLFATSKLSREEKQQRNALFGTWKDASRPVRPFKWRLPGGDLLEIPVTTMPWLKIPLHLSYLVYLAKFSRPAARSVSPDCARRLRD